MSAMVMAAREAGPKPQVSITLIPLSADANLNLLFFGQS
jgi:hypothetical protein